MNREKQLPWVAGIRGIVAFMTGLLLVNGCQTSPTDMRDFRNCTLEYSTPADPGLQREFAAIHETLRRKYGLTPEQASAGLLDLRTGRLALVEPDRLFYGASVPKIGILLAYFELNPQSIGSLPRETRHELGLMIKASSNEVAAKYSQLLGLSEIRRVLGKYEFYDAARGGGIWVGKHYGVQGERVGDPVGDHSHAATVRQLLRFGLLLEQGKLVSPAASRLMLEIFESPDIPHDHSKFVKGLAGHDVLILRKSGSWEDWLHDLAIVRGENQHYILAALTHHPQGDEYLADLAQAVHAELTSGRHSGRSR